ncbi:MAG: hypothetical protein KJ066_21815 [Acidobacteria bacterium]|nr:hypothetical protein [Acidobacteriota bacterium]
MTEQVHSDRVARERIPWVWMLVVAVAALFFARLVVPEPVTPWQHGLRAMVFWLGWYPAARHLFVGADPRREWRYWVAAVGASASSAALVAIWP